jgi:hypothetical protein
VLKLKLKLKSDPDQPQSALLIRRVAQFPDKVQRLEAV